MGRERVQMANPSGPRRTANSLSLPSLWGALNDVYVRMRLGPGPNGKSLGTGVVGRRVRRNTTSARIATLTSLQGAVSRLVNPESHWALRGRDLNWGPMAPRGVSGGTERPEGRAMHRGSASTVSRSTVVNPPARAGGKNPGTGYGTTRTRGGPAQCGPASFRPATAPPAARIRTRPCRLDGRWDTYRGGVPYPRHRRRKPDPRRVTAGE